jgi:hypothetical protein
MDLPRGTERADHQGVLPVRLLVALMVALAGACASDPVYLGAVPPALDVAPGLDADAGVATTLTLRVPLALPGADDEKKRMDLATQLALPLEQIPTARRDETDLEIEWSLANAGTKAASAKLAVNGANELFRYDPAAAVVDPKEDAPPPLMGGRPIDVPAGQTTTGVFREDELAEAAQDLDAFSRGGVVLEKTLITRWPTRDVTGGMGGVLARIPSAIIPVLLELDVGVTTDQPLRLTCVLRVRDRSGRLRPLEMDRSLLVAPSTTTYVPPPPPMMTR